jgi:hypothetical protein
MDIFEDARCNGIGQERGGTVYIYSFKNAQFKNVVAKESTSNKMSDEKLLE